MLVTIYPVADFHGAANPEGTKTQNYQEGTPYEVHPHLADLFIENGLVAVAPVNHEDADDAADSETVADGIDVPSVDQEADGDSIMDAPEGDIQTPADPDGVVAKKTRRRLR